MRQVFASLLASLARATDRELARQVQYLKVENRILRDMLPRRLTITSRERQRLLKFGKALGAALKDIIGIVSPRTFRRWLQGENKPERATPRKQRGRPRTPADIRELILRLARENSWGYTRIHGELKKLGVRVSRSTVANTLREAGLDPGPRRGEGTWDDFIQRHLETLWACDFFSTKVWTMRGLVEIFVLFFIHLGSRRVHLAGITAHPDSAWMAQQARNVALFFAEQPQRPRYLLRDRDSKFTRQFDSILASEGLKVTPVGPRAPNLNAFAERWVRSIKEECLGHFIVFGEAHLRHLVTSYVEYYNQFRPHQGLGNRPLTAPAEAAASAAASPGAIVCEARLGGLLRHYVRRAG